jgi:hypothetical protein
VLIGSDVEDLLHDRADRRQRIELARLHRVEQPPQLRIVGHRALQVRRRPRRRDGEHLAGQILPPPLLQAAVVLQERAVRLEPLPELLDPLAPERLREHDRHVPFPVAELQDRADVVEHRLRGRVVALVDRDHVRDLHDPGLQRLHRVARAGHQHEQDGVRDADHLDLALTGADRLEEEEILAARVEHEHRLQRRLREAAEVASRPHRADEHLGVEEVVGEPDPVAEQGSVREGARRVDGDDADAPVALADVTDERRDETRLADAGWACDPDRVRLAGVGVDLANELVGERVAVLDQRDRPRERAPVARANARHERLARPLPPARHAGESRCRSPRPPAPPGRPRRRRAWAPPPRRPRGR